MFSVLLALIGYSVAWYLPGMAPTDYEEGDTVPLSVNRLTSSGHGHGKNSILGIDYYNSHLHFCEPKGGKKSQGGSLGAILFGDRIYSSPITLQMMKNEECRFLCTAEYSSLDADVVVEKIMQGFEQHWLVDGLPAAGVNSDGEVTSSNGFPLGRPVDLSGESYEEAELNNHFDIVVKYHFNQAVQKYRVVGVQVQGSSRNTQISEADFKCSVEGKEESTVTLRTDHTQPRKVSFSYSVKWEPSETPWGTRWDQYLQGSEPKINWFALVNTTLLVVVLCTICNAVLTRMLRKDIARYNHVDLGSDDIPDEMGWKLVAGDVFRAPSHPQAYAIAIGSGCQMLVTMMATLFLAMLGFLSPANRGSFTTSLLLLNTVFGGIGGYVSAVAYKTWGGTRWKANLLLTPLVIPAIGFGFFMCINLLLVIHDASGAVPLSSMVVLLLIWGGISLPLSLVCGFFGFKKNLPYPPNMRVNQIARQIPPQPWYFRKLPMMLFGGIIPVLAVSLQLRYIMSAIWFQRIYYMFGFLFFSTVAMIILSASSSLLALYYTLVSENYRWQWTTFCVAGSPGIYVFLYSCYYMAFSMSLQTFTGRALYLAYSFLVSMLCFLALGSVGSITSYFLVRRIYESIKVD